LTLLCAAAVAASMRCWFAVGEGGAAVTSLLASDPPPPHAATRAQTAVVVRHVDRVDRDMPQMMARRIVLAGSGRARA